MTREPRKPPPASGREARLKAALRANLSRRKERGRAVAEQVSDEDEQHRQQPPQNGETPRIEE